ncbi:PREDICTED: coiled-coil domain-containing protein 158 [Gekko japonicus]|uniref:Coiled-coil domain-containing protein 158 n=1 Tax=Gekko japonicus TaxID=146911 RepID=A0ABM1L9F8_GEKJA|nr:PREDICTED: coiled-coil domain-containing protein 158 [Gekko japonicus]
MSGGGEIGEASPGGQQVQHQAVERMTAEAETEGAVTWRRRCGRAEMDISRSRADANRGPDGPAKESHQNGKTYRWLPGWKLLLSPVASLKGVLCLLPIPPQKEVNIAAAGTVTSSCAKMSKNSKNIQELREALERQTKETLKLQEEATKCSVDSISRREGSSSPSSVRHSNASTPFTGSPKQRTPSIRSTMPEPCSSTPSSPPKTLYSKFEGDAGSPRRGSNPGKEPAENVFEDYSQQVRDLQKRLCEATELHEQQKFSLRQTVIELQTSLREVQREKDSVCDLRRRESQTSEDVCAGLRATIKELETANHLHEEMLKEANNQTEHLKTMVQAHEEVLQELRDILVDYEQHSGKKVCENETVSSLHIRTLPTAFIKIIRDLEAEVMHVKSMIAPLEEQLEVMKKESESKTQLLLQQHQDSLERLISEHEMELEAVNEKASASHSHASNIQSQLEIIQEQARNQSSLYMRQIGQLEDTVSQLHSELRETRRMSEDKIEDLEKQLLLAHSEMSEAQSERDQFSQESGNLDDQVQHLAAELHRKDTELKLEKEQNKRLWDRDTGSSITIDHLRRELDSKNMELQRMESLVNSVKKEYQDHTERQMSAIKEKNESLEKVASMTVQQESTKEMLRKVVEELTEKTISLESAERQVAELTVCLQEKERTIDLTNSEIQKLRGRVDSRLYELQQLKSEGDHLRSLQADCEAFRMQLKEKEKVIEILRKQIDNMTQILGQHGRTAGAVEVEKAQLLKELHDKKQELQELKLSQDKKESRIYELEASLSEMELEKVKVVNMNAGLVLERDELVNKVKSSRLDLVALAEESDVLKSDYRLRSEEMETTVSKLRVQLKSAHMELEQTRATLKTMEGSDGHAMKVAMGMQKQITAKRGQIDALQSKIKFLEEAMTNATKEKHYLKEERNKLSQELSHRAALNNKMMGELEILRAQDKRMKEKLATMEAALDKASMQFAEYQCIKQRQEQELMRCKLQHALDVKELQGPGYKLGFSSVKLRHSTVPHSHPPSAPSSQAFAGHMSHISSKLSSAKEDPLCDLKQLLQELRSTIDEIPSAMLPRRESDSDSDSLLETASNTLDLASKECIGKRPHDSYSREVPRRDLSTDVSVGQDPFSREPLLLRTADLEDPDVTLTFPSSATHTIFTSTPRYTTSKRRSPERFKERSPVHTLLTAPLDDLKAVSGPSLERRSSPKKSSSPEASTTYTPLCPHLTTVQLTALSTAMQAVEVGGVTCRNLQDKVESLQNLVETLHLENQAMSSMIRSQEKKIEKAKEKERKLSK